MNLVLSNRVLSTIVLQTPLKEKFIIASMNRAEAQAFIAVLNSNKKVPNKGVPVLA